MCNCSGCAVQVRGNKGRNCFANIRGHKLLLEVCLCVFWRAREEIYDGVLSSVAHACVRVFEVGNHLCRVGAER